jgi:arylsulfatase A-like enzyme
VIEWPARIPQPRVSEVNAVTSDLLPTICDLTGQPLPKRPLDGISLKGLIDGDISERPSPIFFWSYKVRGQQNAKPYIKPELQQGTTPLVKLMRGIPTRNFQNFHHPRIVPEDFAGPRVVLDNDYKLVIHEGKDGELITELFNLREDRSEQNNLSENQPDRVQKLEQQLRQWQHSVLSSLTGADYL